jgi:hypothetical protein
VDVKGLSSNSDWLIHYKPLNPEIDMFYILVRVGEPDKEEDKFFIMSHADVNEELEAYYAKRNTPVKEARMQGFSFKQANTHLNKWGKLPK